MKFLLLTLAVFASCTSNSKSNQATPPDEKKPMNISPEVIGTDSDSDGIRDDVSKWIEEKVPSDDKRVVRSMAKMQQQQIVLASKPDAEVAVQQQQHVLKQQCLYKDLSDRYLKYAYDVRSRTFNSPERLNAYFNARSRGLKVVEMTTPEKLAKVCEGELK